MNEEKKAETGTFGLLQVYTGPGKGKTSASVGLAARAVSAGLKIVFIQFAKPGKSGEISKLEELGVTCYHYGAEGWIKDGADKDNEPHVTEALRGWRKALTYLHGEEQVDVLVLDEINVVLKSGLLETDKVMSALINRPHGLEVVCTGRGAPPELIMAADLVTEMLEIKHYYKQGVKARKGIEY